MDRRNGLPEYQNRESGDLRSTAFNEKFQSGLAIKQAFLRNIATFLNERVVSRESMKKLSSLNLLYR